jgi:hypothetical protein
MKKTLVSYGRDWFIEIILFDCSNSGLGIFVKQANYFVV